MILFFHSDCNILDDIKPFHATNSNDIAVLVFSPFFLLTEISVYSFIIYFSLDFILNIYLFIYLHTETWGNIGHCLKARIQNIIRHFSLW